MTNEGVATTPAPPSLAGTSVPGVYRRPGGTYTVRTRVRGRQVTRAARTLAEARAVLADLRSDPRVATTDPRLTLEAYGEEWLRSYQGRRGERIRPETLDSYRRSLERHVFPHVGMVRLVELSPPDVKALATELSRHLRPSSVRRTLAPLKAMLADAAEDGLIRASPAAHVRVAQPATPSEERVKILSDREVSALIAAAGSDRDRLMIRVQAATGVRTSELLGLQWRDLSPRFLKVRRAVNRTRRVGAPKSRAGTRSIPIPALLSRDLAALRKASDDNAAFIFPSAVGTAMDPKNYDHRIFGPAAKRAELPGVSPHRLRHTFVSRMLAAGWGAKQVQVVVGHSSVQMTLDTYGHLFPDDLPPALPEVAMGVDEAQGRRTLVGLDVETSGASGKGAHGD